jgi:hypothetical protein
MMSLYSATFYGQVAVNLWFCLWYLWLYQVAVNLESSWVFSLFGLLSLETSWNLESAWSILPYLSAWVFKLLDWICLEYLSLLLKTVFPRIQSWECMELPSLSNSFTLLFLQHSYQHRGSVSLILIPRLQSYMGDKRAKQWFLLAAWQGQNSSRLLLGGMLFQSTNLRWFYVVTITTTILWVELN